MRGSFTWMACEKSREENKGVVPSIFYGNY
jgi:hypothetical protein